MKLKGIYFQVQRPPRSPTDGWLSSRRIILILTYPHLSCPKPSSITLASFWRRLSHLLVVHSKFVPLNNMPTSSKSSTYANNIFKCASYVPYHLVSILYDIMEPDMIFHSILFALFTLFPRLFTPMSKFTQQRLTSLPPLPLLFIIATLVLSRVRHRRRFHVSVNDTSRQRNLPEETFTRT
jgi:hypothetical protein